jgi:hypothetical protein
VVEVEEVVIIVEGELRVIDGYRWSLSRIDVGVWEGFSLASLVCRSLRRRVEQPPKDEDIKYITGNRKDSVFQEIIKEEEEEKIELSMFGKFQEAGFV